jgi:hypothetical protein
MIHPHSKRAKLAERLRQEHAQLAAMLDDLSTRAGGDEWRDCDERWDAFAATIERHMDFEERLLFPAFAATSKEAAHVVERLIEQHRALRAKTSELGLALQVDHIAPSPILRLVDELRAHASSEDALFYGVFLGPRSSGPEAPAPISSVAAGGIGLVGGMTMGAAAGAVAGPPGALTGAIIGSVVGAVTGVTMGAVQHSDAEHDAELDRAIGVLDGSLGEASARRPGARVGAPSSAAAGEHGSFSG